MKRESPEAYITPLHPRSAADGQIQGTSEELPFSQARDGLFLHSTTAVDDARVLLW